MGRRIEKLLWDRGTIFYPWDEHETAKTVATMLTEYLTCIETTLQTQYAYPIDVYLVREQRQGFLTATPLPMRWWVACATLCKWTEEHHQLASVRDSMGWNYFPIASLTGKRSFPVIVTIVPPIATTTDKESGWWYLPLGEEDTLRMIVAHELTHTVTWRWKLPPWLEEGLAKWMSERCLGRALIDPSCLYLLQQPVKEPYMQMVERGHALSDESETAYYIHGYWIARYLIEQTQAAVFQTIFESSSVPLLFRLSAQLGLTESQWTSQIHQMVFKYYVSRIFPSEEQGTVPFPQVLHNAISIVQEE